MISYQSKKNVRFICEIHKLIKDHSTKSCHIIFKILVLCSQVLEDFTKGSSVISFTRLDKSYKRFARIFLSIKFNPREGKYHLKIMITGLSFFFDLFFLLFDLCLFSIPLCVNHYFPTIDLHSNKLEGSIHQIFEIQTNFCGKSLTHTDLSDNYFSTGIE